MRFLLAVFLSLTLAACAVGPDYRRPETAVPAEFQYRDSTAFIDTAAAATADTAWWQLFGDTVMTGLIQTALKENNDIRIAAARVEQFMGLYGVTKSDFFPKFGAEATGARGQFPLTGTGDEQRPTANNFQVNVNAAWELDLWGKIRRATEGARADLLASEEARRGVVLSVVSLVADTYINLLSLDRQREIAVQTAESRARSLGLFQQRKSKGDISDLELSQIESEYWLARSRVPSLERQVAQTENALSVLLGRNPDRIIRGGVIDSLRLPPLSEGIPSELLERRPDVRQAEELLRSANARIGVAKALYFPSISLTGLLGVASGDLSNLFKSNARVWNVSGGLLAPIFRWGEISGQVEEAEALQKQALEGYVFAVHNAFRDAEDFLVARSRTQEEVTALGHRVDALAAYARLSRMRYNEGVTAYLEVLDAERSLFDTQLTYAQRQAGLLQSAVGVYRALAGGWADRAAAASFQPADPTERREPER